MRWLVVALAVVVLLSFCNLWAQDYSNPPRAIKYDELVRSVKQGDRLINCIVQGRDLSRALAEAAAIPEPPSNSFPPLLWLTGCTIEGHFSITNDFIATPLSDLKRGLIPDYWLRRLQERGIQRVAVVPASLIFEGVRFTYDGGVDLGNSPIAFEMSQDSMGRDTGTPLSYSLDLFVLTEFAQAASPQRALSSSIPCMSVWITQTKARVCISTHPFSVPTLRLIQTRLERHISTIQFG